MILVGQFMTIRTTYHGYLYRGGTIPFNKEGHRKGIESCCEQLTSKKRDLCSLRAPGMEAGYSP